MKYEFSKEQINNKWFLVCKSHEHFPMIEYLKDGQYKVVDKDGKPRIEKDFNSALKFAKQTFKSLTKFNRKWDKKNQNC